MSYRTIRNEFHSTDNKKTTSDGYSEVDTRTGMSTIFIIAVDP